MKKQFEQIVGIGMLLFAIGFNLWLYRLEPTATVDPNDNSFQFALVDRTNQIWDFAQQKCQVSGVMYQAIPFIPNMIRDTCVLTHLVDHWVPNWAEGYNLPFYYSHIPQIAIVASHKIVSSVMCQVSSVLPFVTRDTCNVTLFQYYHWIIYLLLSLFPLTVFLSLCLIRLPYLAAGLGALLASHISTDGLYGLDPPSFLWRGYGLSSQLFAMIWLPLAIAYAWKYFGTNPKHQTLNPKQYQNTNVQNPKLFKPFGFGIWNLFRIWNLEFRISDFWMAVLFLTATAMGHLGLGIIAMLSLIPLALSQPLVMILQSQQFSDVYEVTKNELTKLLVLSCTVIFFLSYWVIPIFLADNYHNISFWDPPWKFASYGARQTITRLLNGDLFDWGRGPWMTVLVLVGLIAAAWPKNQEKVAMWKMEAGLEKKKAENGNITSNQFPNSRFPASVSQYFPFTLLFLFWLLFYFGRTTWGGLIDLIPAMKEFHLSRFIVGVHVVGLFLAPIGIHKILSRVTYHVSRIFRRDSSLVLPLVYLIIGLLVYWIIYPQTIQYAKHNDRLIKQANENYANAKTDEEALFAAIRALPAGRVFAGRGGWWGKDFKVAETPYYMDLSTYGIPTVLWLPETWSPNSDVEQYFSENQAKDYDLFGIRYVAALPSQKPEAFWKLIKEAPTWKLYEIELSAVSSQLSVNAKKVGYFTTGVRPAVVATDKRSYGNVVRLWIQSDAHVKGLFPELTFAKDYPKKTGLPNFKMIDEVTYVIPEGSSHNLFSQFPLYLPTGIQTKEQFDKLTREQYGNIRLISPEEVDSDMVFKTKVTVGDNCAECIIVLKQSFHPNWRATIDGKPAQTFTVFPFYLATLVPSGTHEVLFSYEPSPLKVPLLIMEFFFLAILIINAIRMRTNQ